MKRLQMKMRKKINTIGLFSLKNSFIFAAQKIVKNQICI
jgi:hypothetical protein